MGLILIFLNSCASVNNRFLRTDVIGFSSTVKTSYGASRGMFKNFKWQDEPYDLLMDKDRIAVNKTLQEIPRGDNTALYYAMDLAIDRVRYVRQKLAKNDPQTKYYIFLLTDGLDNASPQLAKNEKELIFGTTNQRYRARIARKLKNAMGLFAKNTFEVYPMLFEGDDLMEIKAQNPDKYEEHISNSMECLRYSTIGEAPKINKASSYDSIMVELRKQFLASSYTFRVSKSLVGKRIKMTLENSKGKKVEVIGTLKRDFFSYAFTDIDINGENVSTAKIGQYTKKNGKKLLAVKEYGNGSEDLNVYFTLEDIRLGAEPYFPVRSRVTQHIDEGNDFWILNSEYREVTEHSFDTYFVLVVDGSTSLDGKNHNQNGFEAEQKMAKGIVDMIIKPKKKEN